MASINSFQDTMIGSSSTTLAQFILTPDIDLTAAFVVFELLDEDGKVYSTGNGSSLTLISKPNATLVQSTIIIPIPSTIPVNDVGTTYQVRLTLTITPTNIKELYSNLKVLPKTLTYLGTGDTIDIKSNVMYSPITIASEPSAINALLYFNNDLVNIASPLVVSTVEEIADGYFYNAEINSGDPAIMPSLVPYNVIWQYITDKNNTESAYAWIVTPSILTAIRDLMSEINKARSSIRDKPTFSAEDALLHLRLGGDFFNGFADTTMFTFTNATGPVRSYWLGFSKISALRSQFMYEAESNFDFQGQSIQLTVQREQYYESLAAAIENQIYEPAKSFKAILSKRGNINGDGNVNPNAIRPGAMGCVGVTLSPVSRIRPWNPNSWLGGQRSIF